MPNQDAKKPNRQNKVIAVTIGDPQGIGPEIVQKSLAAYTPHGGLVIVGSRRFFPVAGIANFCSGAALAAGETVFLDVDSASVSEDISFVFVQKAVQLALSGQVQAVVTAPINKNKWLHGKAPYRGHTDYFESIAAGASPAMFFWSKPLKVALFTHHVPLREVFTRISPGKITAFVRLVAGELKRLFAREFIFYFSGLNPHAGENGFLGSEEEETIIPALAELQGEIPIAGLFPPDVVFNKARAVKDAVVIAWTHDQGLIPFKLLHAGSGVQLTLGLPFIRTSPVHGTAYDIAGKGMADHASMLAAMKLAASLLR
ncbi:MAG: 4-hydroxythreonine-4-phosphate dehydrogenase PdxA [Candidatus Aminicenantes bacterium]|nr:4-hydroxythreonine-4-phosphate dehydrogenase PdxA [Candidatus Aminicenantes bacterium]